MRTARAWPGRASADAVPWRRAGDRNVPEFISSAALRSISPPRLMSPRPTKSTGKADGRRIRQQHVHVLRRCDAAEQNDTAVGSDVRGERPRAPVEGLSIRRVVGRNVDARKLVDRAERDECVRSTKPRIRSDDEHPSARRQVIEMGGCLNAVEYASLPRK